MNYFEKEQKDKSVIKILIGVIIIFLFTILIMIKSFINVIDSKEVHIEVPQILEAGEYKIGVNKTSDTVYEMWTKIWMNEIASFSHENIRDKFIFMKRFLDRTTAYQMRKEIDKNIELVEDNYINQTYEIDKVYIDEELSDEIYSVVKVEGIIKRNIGTMVDPLSGSNYVYEFKLYVKNGNVYIKTLNNYVKNLNSDSKIQRKVFENKYINFDLQNMIDKKDGKEQERFINRLNKLKKENKEE